MSKINTRSPYYITIGVSPAVANLTQVDMQMYIYTGEKITDRSNLFQLSSFAINEIVTFEISEIINDYIINTFDGDYSSQNVWIDYRTRNYIQGAAGSYSAYTTLRGFNGYGYFEDGANPVNDSSLLQSNNKIVKLDDAPAVIAVDTETTNSVTYELNGEIVYTNTISTSLQSDEQIEYISNTINGADEFENRVIQDGGTFEDSICLQQFAGDFTLFDFDTIYIDTDSGIDVITIDNVSECKYQPHKVTFVNKFGALQDVWFFKRSNESLTTKKEDFKRNIIANGSYDTSRHQQKILTKNGKEKLTLNTGFYPEQYNEIFKQMQLSEDCWIEINNQTLPITISSSSFNYKTHLNDKLINYTIQIEFAFDTINNIR